jgi:hypothetical protein
LEVDLVLVKGGGDLAIGVVGVEVPCDEVCFSGVDVTPGKEEGEESRGVLRTQSINLSLRASDDDVGRG